MKKILRFSANKIKDTDRLGDQFYLTQENRPQYSTLIGGILSIIATILGTAIIILFIIAYFDNTSPELSEIYRRTELYPKFDLYNEKFNTGFIVKSGKELVPPQILSKYVTFKYVTFSLDSVGSTAEEKFTFFDMIPCVNADKKLYSFPLSYPPIKGVFAGFGMCLDIKDPSSYIVRSSASIRPYQRVAIYVFPCSLPNPANCASPADFLGLSILFVKSNVAFDPTNFKKPISVSVDSDLLLAFDITQSYSWEGSFRKNEIWDERIDFIGEQFKESYIDFETVFTRGIARPAAQLACTTQQIISSLCAPYFVFDFKSGNQLKKIKRTYKMVLDTLGNMGGIFEITFSLAAVLYCCYKERARNNYMHTIVHHRPTNEYTKYFDEEDKKLVSDSMVDMIERQ